MRLNFFTLVIVIIMALIGTVVILFRQNATLRGERDQAQKFAMADARHIEWYKNELGKETARAKVLELTVRNAKAMADDKSLDKARQFKGVKDNLNNVDQVTTIDAEIDTAIDLTAGLNSDSSQFYAYNDKYNRVNLIMWGSDSLKPKLDLNIQVPLTGVIFWQRRKFLGLRIGRKEYKADITCDNPLVKITGLEVIRIQKR